MKHTWLPWNRSPFASFHPRRESSTRPLYPGYASPGLLGRYGYSLAASFIVTLVMSALGFTLVSSLRHLLWWLTMNQHQPMPMGVIVVLIVSTVFIMTAWYRIVHAALVGVRQRRSFFQQIHPLLTPLPSTLRVQLGKYADWYLIDDENRLAFTWGLRRSRVAISNGLWGSVSESARTAVAYHEFAHVLNRDSWQQVFLQTLAKAFGPVGIESLYKRYLIRREILADSLAIAASQGDEAPLLEAMLAVARSASRHPDTQVNLGGALDARIAFLETGMIPDWWGGNTKSRFISTGVAFLLTVAEGLVVWCH